MLELANYSLWDNVNNKTSTLSPKIKALGGLYIGTSVLSLVGSASIVLAVLIKKKVSNAEVRPIFHLSLADMVASSSLLLGAAPYMRFGFNSTSRQFCSYVTAISSCFYMNTFIFTALYGYEVYSKLTSKLNRRNFPRIEESFSQIYCLYSFAWIGPLAVTLCIFAIDSGEAGKGSLNDDICGTCLPVFHYRVSNCSASTPDVDHEPNWNSVFQLIFIGVLLIAVLTVLVIYVLVLNTFRKIQKSGGILTRLQYKQETSVRRWACLYQVVFVICWLPSMILGLCSLSANYHMLNYYPLYVIQASITPLQGFFNCIIYGWRRRGFTRILRQKNYQSFSDNTSTENTRSL